MGSILFQEEGGIRGFCLSRGSGEGYKRQQHFRALVVFSERHYHSGSELPGLETHAQRVVAVYAVSDSGLRTQVPGVVAAVCFFEMERGVLGAEPCRHGHFVDAVEIFGKEIQFVLTLMGNYR